jgi:hypothetical protein
MEKINELKSNIIIGDSILGYLFSDSWHNLTENQSDTRFLTEVFGCEVDYVRIVKQAQINSIDYLIVNQEEIKDKIIYEVSQNKIIEEKIINQSSIVKLFIFPEYDKNFSDFGILMRSNLKIDLFIGLILNKTEILKMKSGGDEVLELFKY